MPEFKKMTVDSLRDLARRVLGPGHSRLKTKRDLIAALEEAKRGGESSGKQPAREGAASGKQPPRRKTVAEKATAKAVRAVKAATEVAREGARAAGRSAKAAVGAAEERARKTGKARTSRAAKAAAAVTGALSGAAASVRGRRTAREPGGESPDPEGYFVARVRGEDAVREAPHPFAEDAASEGARGFRAVPEAAAPEQVTAYDEGLGDLPWGYGDDAFVALPRDPRTVFLYWDLARPTLEAGFGGLDHPHAQLWLFARGGDGWERLRAIDFALESRGYYLHDLDPGRTYRAEIHAVDRAGRQRILGHPSNEVRLPPVGPSPVVDDRFARLPWDLPLGRLLGPGHAGGPFPDEARALLSRLSDWSRFAGPSWGGSAGGMGGRPSSPTSGPSFPPSPAGPPGDRER
jgi:hypothetical protein